MEKNLIISEIIGEGKEFEPPFSPSGEESPYIFDANRKIVASIDCAGLEHFNIPTRKLIRAILARHVCELLNREHSEKGGEE